MTNISCVCLIPTEDKKIHQYKKEVFYIKGFTESHQVKTQILFIGHVNISE